MADDDAQGLDPGAETSESTSKTDQQPTKDEHPRRRRRSAHTTRDLTKGSIPKNLWFLAWPQVAESFLSVIDQIADLIWAGRIGFQAIAGLGVGQTYVMMLMTARMGLDAGMRSMISRAVGAKDIAYANHVLLQALTLSAVYSVLVVLVGLFLTESLLSVLGLSEEVVSLAAGYMRIQFFAMAVMSFQRLTGGALQASGDSITPLKAASVTRVTHLVLSPFLIFGIWLFPSMGLSGMAMANLVAQVLGVSLNFYALFKGTSRLSLSFKGYYVDYQLLWRLLKIGAPAAVTGMQRALSQLIVVIIVARFGDGALAAYALTRRAENVVNQSARALGRSSGTLAGQNLGAGLPERAKSSVKWGISYSAVGSIVVAIIFLLFPHNVASFFNSDPEFVDRAAIWLRIMALGYFSMNAVQVFTQAFNTSGDTFAPMVITVATVWTVDVPLAIVLSQLTPLNEYGVAYGMVIGMTFRMMVFTWYYFQGKWLKTGMM